MDTHSFCHQTSELKFGRHGVQPAFIELKLVIMTRNCNDPVGLKVKAELDCVPDIEWMIQCASNESIGSRDVSRE